MTKFSHLFSLFLCGIYFAQTETQDSIKVKNIQEITFEAPRKRQYSDKATYTFEKAAIEKARYAKDLLISLPELQLDPISNTIKSSKGAKTLILINGIKASDNQIRGIAPKSVTRVNYYDIPPTRWANKADIVVDIITKNPENGYNFGIDISSALTTGFVNSSAYGNFTKGKHNFGVEYNINYRNYNNRIHSSSYNYEIGIDKYRSNNERKDHFGYAAQNIALRYTNSNTGKYTLQTKLSLELFDNFNKGTGKNIFLKNSLKTLHNTIYNENSKYLNPTLDLYFSKNLSKKDELIFNIIGAYYNTHSNQFNHEWNTQTQADVFKNDMILEAKQYNFIGEIAHTHQFEKGKLNSGYRIYNNHIINNLTNLEGKQNYSTNYFEQYFYSEYSSKIGKLNYQFSAGLTHLHNKSAIDTENKWTPNIRVILKYSLKNHNFRLFSSYKIQSPWASALSSNVSQSLPNIVKRGNPYLKSANRFSNNFIYSFSNKYFDFNTALFYNYTDRYIMQYYTKDNTINGYALTYQNAKNYTEYGIQISGSVKPFGSNILVLKAFAMPISQQIKTENDVIKHNYIANNFSISSQYKGFNLQYLFNFPVYSLSGQFLNTNENQNHLFLSYKHLNWSFSSGIYWINTPSNYKTKTINSLVKSTLQSTIYNNKNMFVLGISYDFSSGKNLQIQKKLNNNKDGAVTF